MLDTPAPLVPRDTADLLDAIRTASDAETPLELYGHGTKRGIGHAVAARQSVELSALSGVIFYEPEEIVISVHAATPMAEIETLLAANRQELAFEPQDYGPLFGLPRGSGTIGGALAANLGGPRRIKAGAARDHVLGIAAVSGRGEMFKSGGRVVKNVTGYDLSKGLSGSWGTLAAFTELTFKVLPRAEFSSTLVVFGLDDAAGVELLCRAMSSPAEVSGVAHFPAATAASLPHIGDNTRACTLIRLEGFKTSVLYRAERLNALIGPGQDLVRLDEEASRDLWQAVRDAEPFADHVDPVWRISTAPMHGPAFVEALRAAVTFRHYYDWSGGLVWIEIPDAPADAGASAIRETLSLFGGHATLVRASGIDPSVRRFQPQPPSLAALSRRLKSAFDPLAILNPGRMG